MPVSNVIMLALDLSDLASLAARAGVEFKEPGSTDRYRFEEEVFEPIWSCYEEPLRQAHLELLRARFDPGAGRLAGDSVGDYLVAETPLGPRRLGCFSLALEGDEDEIGDRWPEDFVWGVELTSRYAPTWLDWRDEHGSPGDFRFDEESQEMIEEARRALGAVIPELETADLMVKTVFY